MPRFIKVMTHASCGLASMTAHAQLLPKNNPSMNSLLGVAGEATMCNPQGRGEQQARNFHNTAETAFSIQVQNRNGTASTPQFEKCLPVRNAWIAVFAAFVRLSKIHTLKPRTFPLSIRGKQHHFADQSSAENRATTCLLRGWRPAVP